jgi:hypothetical protein
MFWFELNRFEFNNDIAMKRKMIEKKIKIKIISAYNNMVITPNESKTSA